MSSDHDLSDRLSRERPVPAATFRGDLRRHLLPPKTGPRFEVGRVRSLSGPPPMAYIGIGLVCLAINAAGLVGLGPFAA